MRLFDILFVYVTKIIGDLAQVGEELFSSGVRS
jgi:hypothetical protein